MFEMQKIMFSFYDIISVSQWSSVTQSLHVSFPFSLSLFSLSLSSSLSLSLHDYKYLFIKSYQYYSSLPSISAHAVTLSQLPPPYPYPAVRWSLPFSLLSLPLSLQSLTHGNCIASFAVIRATGSTVNIPLINS